MGLHSKNKKPSDVSENQEMPNDFDGFQDGYQHSFTPGQDGPAPGYQAPNDQFRTHEGIDVLSVFSNSRADARISKFNDLVQAALERIQQDKDQSIQVKRRNLTDIAGAMVYYVDTDKGRKAFLTVPIVLTNVPTGVQPPYSLKIRSLIDETKRILGNDTQVINELIITDREMDEANNEHYANNVAKHVMKELEYFGINIIHNLSLHNLIYYHNFRINCDTAQALAYYESVSPSSIRPPCHFAFLLESQKKDKTLSEKEQRNVPWKPYAAVLMYNTVSGPAFIDGSYTQKKFKPVVRISGIASEIEAPGLTMVLLAKAFEQTLLLQRWKEPFLHFNSSGINIGCLAEDPNDNTKVCKANNQDEVRHFMEELLDREPLIQVELIKGLFRPYLYSMLATHQHQLAHVLCQFFGVPSHLFPMGGNGAPFTEFVGTIGEGKALADSRDVTYLTQATRVGRLPARDSEILNNPSYFDPFQRLQVVAGCMPNVRCLCESTVQLLDCAQMGWVLHQLVDNNVNLMESFFNNQGMGFGNRVFVQNPGLTQFIQDSLNGRFQTQRVVNDSNYSGAWSW